MSKSAEPFVAIGFSVAPVEIITYLDLADAVCQHTSWHENIEFREPSDM